MLVISSNKKKLSGLNQVRINKRLSQSMLPKTTDINSQAEQLLPEISITNKRLTQVAPVSKQKKARQVMLKANVVANSEGSHDCDTEGHAVRSPLNSTGEGSADGGVFTVMKSGAVTLQEVKPEVVFSHISSPAKLSSLPNIIRV